MSSHLSENLSVLERRAPDVARAIMARGPGAVQVGLARDGTPNLIVGGTPLHNAHSPLEEARRWAQEQLGVPGRAMADCLVVLGFGAGYHLAALAQSWGRRMVVIEPGLDVLRAALEITDLTELLERIELRLDAPADAEIEGFGRTSVLCFAPALGSDRSGFRSLRRAVYGSIGRRHVRLKILVVSPLHGGTLPMTGYVARALAELGHAVSVLDFSPFHAGFENIAAFGAHRERRQALEGRFVDFLAAGILHRVEYEQPDLVLALAQAPLTAGLLDRLTTDGVKTALWFVEDFRRFPYWEDVGPRYSYVFCIQRDECLQAFAVAGVTNACYLPCAADQAVHVPLQLSPTQHAEYGSAVSFVGAGYRNRRVTFRRLVDLDFKIWGNGWQSAEGLWGHAVQRDGSRVSTEDSVLVFNASTINLNLHSSTYVDGVDPLGDFVNPRTFELAASGAFQLVDERRYLPELFVPGSEVATFASAAELRERINYFLGHPDERDAIAAAARRRALAEHTYKARMGELLDEVFGIDYEHFLVPRAQTHGTAALVEAAGRDTALGRYLQRVCGDLPDVGLEDLALRIQLGQGPLTEEEEIMVFLKHYDDMFLSEYRP